MSPRPHHKIHNVRFLSLTPASVSCLAYSPEAALLAVSRADNSIEIWNVAASPFLQVERGIHTSSTITLIFACGHGQPQAYKSLCIFFHQSSKSSKIEGIWAH